MKRLTSLTIFLLYAFLLKAELAYQHFSIEDGMSQNTVMSIIQDHKGFMWFGTWDGLNKFDGYQFTTYKSHPGSNTQINNNRIDFLYEDKLHYIWFQTYDGMIHRFNTKAEQFYSLNTATQKMSNNLSSQDHFVETADGELWIDAIDSVIHISGEEPDLETFHVKGMINCIVSDNNNNIWVGTQNGLYLIENNKINECSELNKYNVTSAFAVNNAIWFGTADGVLFKKTYGKLGFERFSLINAPKIEHIKVLENRFIIITTADAGFYLYNYIDHKVDIFSSATTSIIKNNHFGNIMADSHGMVWLENEENGIFLFNPNTHKLDHLQTSPDPKYAHNIGPNLIVFEDKSGRIWINPQGGGFGYYDRDANAIISIPNLTNIIHTAFVDNKGALWVSTYAKGVDRVSKSNSQFSFTNLDDEVRSLHQTSQGLIIAGTKDGRTHIFNGTETRIANRKESVYSVAEDKNGHIWLGTRGNGLIEIEKADGKILNHYVNEPGNPKSLSNNSIYAILFDSAQNIYLATYGGGLNILTADRSEFLNSKNRLTDYPIETCSKTRTLMLDSDGILWIGTTSGLAQMNTHDYTFHYSQKEIGNINSLGNNDIHSIIQDRQGNVWIGTFGAGLNKVVKHSWNDYPIECENFSMLNGLPSDIVLSIQEDRNGNLWLTSENNITRIEESTGLLHSFAVFKGSSDMYFTESNAIELQSGELMFACSDGICSFNPDRILMSDDTPNIEFTRFQLFNTDVAVGAKDSPLPVSISECDKIVLKHDQSVFSIEYAALDFSDANILYAFMLDGFEKEWNYVDYQRKATYTNLPQGTYTFRVISTNSEGVWVNNEHDLTIVVEPSFWQTPWAIMIYTILVLILLYFAYTIVKRYNSMRQNIEVEQKVTDIKLRFFTNISHELRTPLTLISAPIENILTNEYISQGVRDQLEIVKSNSDRMLRMINQILDFRKLQNKKMRLKVQATDISELVRHTCANFNKEALDKHIQFYIHNNLPEPTELYIDRDKMDIILYNLLSNAFKFTPAGKSIEVILEDKKDYVSIAVKDQGIGIDRNKISTLFERFTSNNEINSNFNIIGTGIGLNLVKELTDLHHGYIEVQSEKGEGSTFTIMIKKGKEHLEGEADFIVDDAHIEGQGATLRTDPSHIVESIDNPTLLVVDDNDDMCNFLSEILNKDYNVVIAKDGQEGVDKAREIIPALIISDLMMPNKDGLELVNDLKQDMSTSHIPIILLTAKTAIESRLDAMRYGADDYITKPFSPVYLAARINNILEQRQRLQESYRQNLMNLNPQVEKQSTPDERFLAKLMTVMDKNISNSELTVDALLSEMALGRTVFYNKLKGLTGFSPVEFIREVRIKRAAQLLETGQYSVTEVTYMVGMNDARYFSKCFKNTFGVTPSDYKRNMTKQ